MRTSPNEAMDGVAAARRLLVDICVEVEVCPVQVLHHEILPRTKLLADVVSLMAGDSHSNDGTRSLSLSPPTRTRTGFGVHPDRRSLLSIHSDKSDMKTLAR